MRPPHPLTRLVTVTALAGLGLTGCADKDPWINPACTQLPAAAIRSAITDLGTVPDGSPHTGVNGTENGQLPVTNLDKIYWCKWPAADPDADHSAAFIVTVQAIDPSMYAQVKRSISQHNGPDLTSSIQGEGRAWKLDQEVSAEWLCPHEGYASASQRLTVYVNRPAHKQDPAADAKTLAEAIIPLVGCTPGKATPTPSGPTPTGPDTVPPSSTPSH
jgi:hypothetical protein